MRVIIYGTCILLFFSCGLSKKQLSDCSFKPDFDHWKRQCIEQFNDTFPSGEGTKKGTIANYIRDEIERIDTKEIDSLFCKTKSHSPERITFIYHYIEGEVNYSVQSFIFYDEGYCETKIWNPRLKKMKTISDCNFNLISFESNFSNNGLLILASFNDRLELIKNQMYYGLSFSQIKDLVALYD